MSISRRYTLVLLAGGVNRFIWVRIFFTKHTLHVYLLTEWSFAKEIPSQKSATNKHCKEHATKSNVL